MKKIYENQVFTINKENYQKNSHQMLYEKQFRYITLNLVRLI